RFGSVAAILAACGGGVVSQGSDFTDAGPKKAPPTLTADPPPDPPPDNNPGGIPSIVVADEFGSEVQLAVSSSGRIVVAWIGISLASSDATIRYAVTDDVGATFTPAASVGSTVGDPVVGALDDGSFLLGGLRANCPSIDTCTDGELFLSKMPAGATSVEMIPSLREPTNAFIDHPWMSVHGQDVSLIGAVFPQDDAGMYDTGMTVWRSGDRGGTFQRTELVVADSANQMGIPRFCGGDGTRTWAHFYDGTTPTYGRLRWTDSLDEDWTATNTTSFGGDGGGTLETTGACAAHGDTLYAVIGTPGDPVGTTQDATPTFTDLHVLATNDLGQTWNEQAHVAVSGASYLLPEIDVAPDGTVDLFYYTGTAEKSPARAELVRIHGTKADAPVVLRSGLSFISDRGSEKWLGDYNAIGYAGGKPIFAFGDNSVGTTRIRFAHLP
ncbi:MAG TPA: hypothetical protein VIF62_33435, partial [Labilithrix sp.]